MCERGNGIVMKVFIGGELKKIQVENLGEKNGKNMYKAESVGTPFNFANSVTEVEVEHNRKDGLDVLVAKIYAKLAGGSFLSKAKAVIKKSSVKPKAKSTKKSSAKPKTKAKSKKK